MNQEDLVADVLGDYVPIGDVPQDFAEAMVEHIARRPSPSAAIEGPTQLDRVESKLDELLTLLRGGTPE